MSSFDDLPSAILQSIFDYFWAHELIEAFLHVNVRITKTLFSYHRYHLNFRSISKRQFEKICAVIRADHIESLILSDDDSTVGQTGLFFSLFPLDHFVRLRSIELIETDEDIQLNFFSVPLERLIISINCTDLHQRFPGISFLHLRHLSLGFCSLVDYRTILDQSISLRSLKVSLSVSNCSAFDFVADQQRAKPIELRSLKLTISSFGKNFVSLRRETCVD